MLTNERSAVLSLTVVINFFLSMEKVYGVVELLQIWWSSDMDTEGTADSC